MRKMPLLARPVNEREAILFPQMNIEKNDIRQGFRGNAYETLFQSRRKDCFVAFGFEPVLEELAILGIVIDHKNPLLHSASFCRLLAVGGDFRAQTKRTTPDILSS